MRVGSHCYRHTADPFLTQIRWPTRTRSGIASPRSLVRQHLRRRCGSLLVPDHFFLAVASLPPSVRQALPGNMHKTRWRSCTSACAETKRSKPSTKAVSRRVGPRCAGRAFCNCHGLGTASSLRLREGSPSRRSANGLRNRRCSLRTGITPCKECIVKDLVP